IRHSHRNRPIGKLPAADAGYRTTSDGGHGHFGKAVVVGGKFNGRRGNFGDETASRIEPVMAYPFFLTLVVVVVYQEDTSFVQIAPYTRNEHSSRKFAFQLINRFALWRA